MAEISRHHTKHFLSPTDGISAQASLNLTPEERRVYGQFFQQADTEGLGVVTGDVAVKFFEKTKLDASVLGEVSIGLMMFTKRREKTNV